MMQFIVDHYGYILGTVATLSVAAIISGRRFFLDGVFNNRLSPECSKRDLSEHYAIVTGANRGIGYAITKSLVRKGCHVVLACRSESRAKQAMKSIIEELKGTSHFKLGTMQFVECALDDIHSVKRFCASYQVKIGSRTPNKG